jgi:formylglycine-generating enzyme required for sulfatase activity
MKRSILALASMLLMAHGMATAQSLASKPGTVFRDCRGCPEMVVVPAGSFVMGSSDAETLREGMQPEARVREQPVHTVNLGKPFAVGKFELTRGEYAAFAEATKRDPGSVCTTWDQAKNLWQDVPGATWRAPGFPQTDRDPVTCVSYDDAQAYAGWLSAKTRKSYRLITEAEWEYMARASTTTSRYWGDDTEQICRHANVSDRTASDAHPALLDDPGRAVPCRDGYVYTAPVGRYSANPFGIHDVIGNVWEWVEDCYSATYEGAPTDGSAWILPACDRRVVRGGGWYARNYFNRSAARSRELPGSRMGTLGIRLVRELEVR